MRTCNNEEDFNNKVKTFNEKLLLREYPQQEISNINAETNYATRRTHLNHKQTHNNNTNKLIFATKYSPHIKTKDIKQALLKNWEEIEKDQTLNNLFTMKPIIAYKRNPNIGDTLINAQVLNLRETTEQNATQQTDPNISILASLLDEQNTDNNYCHRDNCW